MEVLLRRRAAFSAAHNYWIDGLSAEENVALFGKYAGSEGHGHNYTVELAVSGQVDLTTGMVVNITAIDQVLKSEVIAPLGNRFLNREVEFFQRRSPSLENIAEYVRLAIADRLPSQVTLVGVTVWEMPTLWAETTIRGSEMTTSLTRSYEFSAAHRLHSTKLSDEENREIFGKCNNPAGHGHNYEVEVTITGEPDARTGMLYDLDKLDRIVDERVVSPLDHKHLNLDVPEFDDMNPTSEMLTVVIWNRLAERIETTGSPRLSKVVVRETARNYFEYRGNE